MDNWNKIQDYDYKEKLPRENCEIWITRTMFDGSRWVQKVDFYAGKEDGIGWDGTLAWMLCSEYPEKPEPYMGDDCFCEQFFR